MLRPCSAKLASGILTVAASVAPPPPPGSTVHGYFDPAIAPPPPPSVEQAAWGVYRKKEILPRTMALCAPGMEGRLHERLCMEMVQALGSWQVVEGIGLRAPLCRSDICWSTCEGPHVGDTDSFHTCPTPECATASCWDFLISVCPPVVHSRMSSIFTSICTLVPPSPPSPPHPPPDPPRPPNSPPPRPPPPYVGGIVRERDTEQEWDADCELVSYAQCRQQIRQYAEDHPGTIDALRASISPCEGSENDQSCFLGCQFGAKVGPLDSNTSQVN
jgi:hypothetical protein